MDREKGAEGCWYSKIWPYEIGPTVAYQKESINIRRERENVMKQKTIIVLKKMFKNRSCFMFYKMLKENSFRT